MLKRLNELFSVSYGNKLDLNKMERITADSSEAQPINFVGRSSRNLGITSRVAPVEGQVPFEAGLITVALGGTKLLASFVQMSPFYTAQNVAVLKPKSPMSFADKLFLCLAIRHNRFRYSAFGREANRTIKELLVPEPLEFPEWVAAIASTSIVGLDLVDKPNASLKLNQESWSWFVYDDLFEIERGRGARRTDARVEGTTPLVTAIDSNNGVAGMTLLPPYHLGNTISVNRNGNGVAEAYYQEKPFSSTEDVHVFTPKFPMNRYNALFLITLIRLEKYRFSYGRKWGLERMRASTIKLPVTDSGTPDWDYMEKFMKSLPFSAQIKENA